MPSPLLQDEREWEGEDEEPQNSDEEEEVQLEEELEGETTMIQARIRGRRATKPIKDSRRQRWSRCDVGGPTSREGSWQSKLLNPGLHR